MASTESRVGPGPGFSQRTSPDETGGEPYPFDVTIGLLCYRDRDLIHDLIASIEQHPSSYKCEWLLSDNGSTDGTREMVREKFPYVRILENGANLGVAAGRNRLFWNSQAKYTLILDSDTLIHPGTIDTLVQTMESRPDIGIVGPQLVYRDGRQQLSCRLFPRLHHVVLEGTQFRRFFEWTGVPAKADMRNVPHDKLMPVDCLYGAALLVRNRLTREVGGFDEGYHYQYEDYDLCYRFKNAGHGVWYDPAATVTHFYEREQLGVFHPRLRSHLKSIFRFQLRNMWGIYKAPVVWRTDLDGERVPRPPRMSALATERA